MVENPKVENPTLPILRLRARTHTQREIERSCSRLLLLSSPFSRGQRRLFLRSVRSCCRLSVSSRRLPYSSRAVDFGAKISRSSDAAAITTTPAKQDISLVKACRSIEASER